MSGLPGAATPQPTLCLPLRSCTPASGKVLWKKQTAATADTSLKSGRGRSRHGSKGAQDEAFLPVLEENRSNLRKDCQAAWDDWGRGRRSWEFPLVGAGDDFLPNWLSPPSPLLGFGRKSPASSGLPEMILRNQKHSLENTRIAFSMYILKIQTPHRSHSH